MSDRTLGAMAMERDRIGKGITPHRVQLSRRKGSRLPEGAVSVARPSRWGNPFVVGVDAVDNAHAVRLFTDYLTANPELVEQARVELRGHSLACYCGTDDACHASVWLRVANDDRSPIPEYVGTSAFGGRVNPMVRKLA